MSNNSQHLDQVSRGQPHHAPQTNNSYAVTETYLSHPVFGLLNKLCIIDNKSALYTSLYANRLFFLVTASANGLMMDNISRNEARMALEKRLTVLRKSNFQQDHEKLREIYKNTFNR